MNANLWHLHLTMLSLVAALDGFGIEAPPKGRLIVIALAFICSPILCLWLGPYYFDNKRRLLGAALTIGGWLLAAFGFGWCLTLDLRGTWGWLL